MQPQNQREETIRCVTWLRFRAFVMQQWVSDTITHTGKTTERSRQPTALLSSNFFVTKTAALETRG